MGKKRSVQVRGTREGQAGKTGRLMSRLPKKKLTEGIIFIEATHTNTKILLTGTDGGVILVASPAVLSFSGRKKSTPFAAGEAAKIIGDKATAIGVKNVDIVVKGIGVGRESALRTIAGCNFVINSIKDKTPVPHNGPKRRKPRRV